MTSEPGAYSEAYVWIFLPGRTDPVVAGKLTAQGRQLVFNYGRRYLERDDAISLYTPELPLRRGLLPPTPGLHMASCIRDASPDAWGRRVLINRALGRGAHDTAQLDELTYLLESGSDRVGALDFQRSPTEYQARQTANASLSELLDAARLVEQGVPLCGGLEQALFHGTSIGGARPKALIEHDGRKFIAKFSSSGDLYNVVKAEYLAMRLAHLAGLDVAPVELVRAAGKDVLLVERFDRAIAGDAWCRKPMVSALTLFGLDEMMARYASYQTLAELIRHRFHDPGATLEELFRRLVFNILCGNTDDHARNHAAFWDGHMLSLTPAYDLCPQARTGNEASQAMLIAGNDRSSRLRTCLSAAADFHLSAERAASLVETMVASIAGNWDRVCSEAGLSEADRRLLWRRQFLNPSVFEGLEDGLLGSLAPSL
ncbi:MAG: type II toxin-antitoxin system HipA family toxin [Gammaproteobacteria bacterium]